MIHRNRKALITGGSSGIGKCIADTLARDGCDVGILYVGSQNDAAEAIGLIKSHQRNSWYHICDVSDPNAVRSSISKYVHDFGRVDILVNAAGITRDQVSWKMTDEEWNKVIDINLSGMFYCCREVIPTMRDSGWGSIINISSINGLRGKFGQTNYSSAKAGVIGLTKALAKETAKFGTTVNAIAPGMIDTPLLDDMKPEQKDAAINEILVGRIGTVEDIAEAAAFLCSDRARFITGEVLRVDGGQYI